MATTAERIQRQVRELSSLPTLPGVVQTISTLAGDINTSAQDMGQIVSRDQVLSSKLLRVVNSPFYGFPGRISSVTHALVLLGFNVVKGLVLSTAVFNSMAARSHGLWRHSLGTAVLARRIAKELKLPQVEEVMVAGLLHDLGKVILSHVAPDEYERVVDLAHNRRRHVAEIELEVCGVDHTRVGGWIAEQWHLPARLQDALIYHHAPGSARHSKEVAAVVHLADILARAAGYGECGDPTMPPLEHDAFHRVGLSFEQIDTLVMAAENEFLAGVDIFSLEEEAR